MISDDNEMPHVVVEEHSQQQLVRMRAEVTRLLSDPRIKEEHRSELLNDPLFAAILGDKS